MTDGETREEAMENLCEAMEGWIETKLENGFDVLEPVQIGGSSGKFTLRLPKPCTSGYLLKPKRRAFPSINTRCIS